jgi:hypothetical protein
VLKIVIITEIHINNLFQWANTVKEESMVYTIKIKSEIKIKCHLSLQIQMHNHNREYLVVKGVWMAGFLLEIQEMLKYITSNNFIEKLLNKQGYKNTIIKIVLIIIVIKKNWLKYKFLKFQILKCMISSNLHQSR